jgi:hypothetical protein
LIIQGATHEYRELRISSVKELRKSIEEVLLISTSGGLPIESSRIWNRKSILVGIALVLAIVTAVLVLGLGFR